MKVLLLSLMLVLVAAPSYAQQDFCNVLAESAKRTMELRQAGVPLANALKMAEGYNEFFSSLVKSAYLEPQYFTKAGQLYAVEKFQTEVHMECMFNY